MTRYLQLSLYPHLYTYTQTISSRWQHATTIRCNIPTHAANLRLTLFGYKNKAVKRSQAHTGSVQSGPAQTC